MKRVGGKNETADRVEEGGHKQPHRGHSVWRIVLVTASYIALALITFGASLALRTANEEELGMFARDFFTSAGFGGLAALVAAGFAFLGISRQVRVSRDSLDVSRVALDQQRTALDHQRAAEEARRWWSTFEWTADRALPPGPDSIPLPRHVSIGTLEILATSAIDDAQRTACSGLVEELGQEREIPSDEVSATPSESNEENSDSSSSASEKVRAALSRYAEATKGSPAESAIARRRNYESRVRQILSETAAEAGLSYESDALTGEYDIPDFENRERIDGVVRDAEGKVALVEVVAYERAGARIRDRLKQLGTASKYPVLFVSPQARPSVMLEEKAQNTYWLQWQLEDSPRNLHEALIEVLSDDQRG